MPIGQFFPVPLFSVPADFPEELVTLATRLNDRADRALTIYATSGASDADATNETMLGRTNRALGTTPIDAADRKAWKREARTLIRYWDEVILRYAEKASERLELLEEAEKAARAPTVLERAGEVAEEVMTTVQVVGIAIIVWALYKSFAAGK